MPKGKTAKANEKREKAIEYREKAKEKRKKAKARRREKANETSEGSWARNSSGSSQPSNLGAQIPEAPWDPNSVAGSQPLDLGPRSTELYQESEVTYTTEGWSYEVYTYTEIYKVSTVPADFVGNIQPWPQALAEAHDEYKQTELSMEEAVKAAFSASWEDPVDHVKVYDLQRNSFELALATATQRADFMRKWPSAFNAHSNTKGHIGWADGLVAQARNARMHGLTSFQEVWPNKDPNEVEWLREKFDVEKIVGRQIYAMSPDQYQTLRDVVQAKKERIRGWAVGTDPEHWQTRSNPNPTVFRPNLPPLNPTLTLPAYTPEDKTRYSLPHHMLEYLKSNDRST